jgi:hypothetical protein
MFAVMQMGEDKDLLIIKSIEKNNKEKYAEFMGIFYEQDKRGPYSLDLYGKIIGLESFIPGYLFDFNTDSDQNNWGSSEEDFIRRIISIARVEFERKYGIDSIEDSMKLKCRDMTKEIEIVCNRLNIKNYVFDFNNPVMQHRAIVICLKSGNNYLVDLTYKQFFLLGNNLSNRHVTTQFPRSEVLIEGPYIGHNMQAGGYEDDARIILQKGYTPIDDMVFKRYTDGFFNTFYQEQNRDRCLLLSTGELMDIIKKRGYINGYNK